MDERPESSIPSTCDLASSYLELQRLRWLVEQAEKHQAIRLCGRAVSESVPRDRRRTGASFAAPIKNELDCEHNQQQGNPGRRGAGHGNLRLRSPKALQS